MVMMRARREREGERERESKHKHSHGSKPTGGGLHECVWQKFVLLRQTSGGEQSTSFVNESKHISQMNVFFLIVH